MRSLFYLVQIWVSSIICRSNIWDNIFSGSEASSPIIFSQSFYFKFPLSYEGIELDAFIDYNNDFNMLCLVAEKNILITKLEAVRIQIEFDNFLITVNSLLRGCEKYKLIFNTTDITSFKKFNVKSKLFLINIFFEYIGRNSRDNTMSQFIFKPDLIYNHTEEHQEFEKNIIVVVDKNGAVSKIYEDQTKKKQVSFSLKSKIVKKLQCSGQVKQITKEDLYQIIKKSIDNKDYEKIPGFDKLPFDKIPNLPNLDKIKFPQIPK